MKMPSIFFHPDALVVLADYIAIQIGCRVLEEKGKVRFIGTKEDRLLIADVLNSIIQRQGRKDERSDVWDIWIECC